MLSKYLYNTTHRAYSCQRKQFLPIISTLTFSYLYSNNLIKQRADCLGIFGYVGEEDKAEDVCIEGLNALSNKGYDSCGVASISKDKQLSVCKFAKQDRFGGDCLQRLGVQLKINQTKNNVGIAHTRWGTHGDITDINAHPHTDQSNRIALVHNGIIENYLTLKDELITQYNINPTSQTDTEIISLMIGSQLDIGKGIVDSIKEVCQKIIGSYVFTLIYNQEPDTLYAVKNTGTMLVGNIQGKNEYYICSEKDILKDQFGITDAQNIQHHEIVKIQPNQITKIPIGSSEAKVKVNLKPGVEHYFTQEMLEQPEAVQKCLNYGARLQGGEKGMVKLGGLDSNEQKLSEIDNLLIGACGTSYYASLYGQFLFRHFKAFKSVEVKIASEIMKEDFPVKNGGLLCVSQSGETTDLLKPFEEAGKLGVTRFNIVNNVESTLAREAGCGIFLNAGKELSIASTKAFICQVVAFSLLTLWFSQKTNYKQSKDIRLQLWNELSTLSQKVQNVVQNCQLFSKNVAQILKDEKHIFLLGLGLGECIAKEGSLKLKELTYKHCQAYSIKNTSNGYFNYAKNYQGTPTFMIILNDQHKEKSFKYLEYVSNQLKGKTFVLTDINDTSELQNIKKLSTDCFQVPYSGFLSALLCIIPIQLAAFEITLALGRDPDRPRNLTKVVL